MMSGRLLNRHVTVTHPVAGAPDRLNRPTTTWTIPRETRAQVRQLAADEIVQGADVQTARYRVTFPAGTHVTGRSRITVTDEQPPFVLQAVGPPRRVRRGRVEQRVWVDAEWVDTA